MNFRSQQPGVPRPRQFEPRNGADNAPGLSWGSDLRNMMLSAVATSAFGTVLMLLSATGLLRTNSLYRVGADGVWAGILAALAPALWAFLRMSFDRDDNGFRKKGLPSLMTVGVLLATLIQLVPMLLWPLVVDKDAHGGTVIAMFSTDPVAFGLVAAFTLAMFAWCSLCVLGFTVERFYAGLVAVCALAVVAGAGVWQGIRIFENPPTYEGLYLWVVIAALGLVLLPLGAAVARRQKHVSAP